ncbi:MAG TPA: RnfABCDGE type electron transport complex subunit G [Spirochaetia bacterium]|nr:RnfABCDGE type electron transport complex subunit G [Spirochaetia bacterium]
MKRMIIVLTSVMVLSGLILAVANSFFSPQIQANKQKALQESMMAIFPDAKAPKFEQLPTDKMRIYKGTDSKGDLLGYAVGVDTSGYGGTISLLVGLAPDLKTIQGMEVVDNVETPGLGARIVESWFRKQFIGLNPVDAISYVKNATPDPAKNQIEAISGATITTKAVVTGLNSDLSKAVSLIKQYSGE